MRVLLIATNRHGRYMSRLEARPLPIGLAYVAGHLDPQQHTTRVLDLMFCDDWAAEVESAVREFRPHLVGLSIRNLDNGSYLDPQWALPVAREAAQKVRAASAATIVCGGPAFSILPRECFAFVEPDLGIVGDAGETFAQLATRLEASAPYRDLPGLVYRDNGNIVFRGTPSSSSFTKPPRLEDLDLARYRRAGFGIGVLTKLDHFSTAASAPAQEGSAWRVIRPVEEVVREVQEMGRRFGLRKVFFIDSGFNIPLAHAKSLCLALIDSGLKLRWNTSLAAGACDVELVDLMKRSGCSLALMSGSGGDSQDRAALGEQLERLRHVCRLCEDGGLHYTITQRFGEPGETRETVDQKLAFLRRLKPALANLRVGVRVLPGTSVARLAMEEGLISAEGDLLRPVFYLAAPVREWLVGYLRAGARQRPRWNLL